MTKGRRDLNESEIVTALRAAGCSVIPVEKKPWDITVGIANKTYLLEIKSKWGTLRPSQYDFHKTWKGGYYVVRTAEEALKAVGL